LTNRTANEATAIATDLGLAVNVDDTRRPDPKIGAGRVIAQEPSAGSIARRQRTVKIWLSAGQRAATVPPLVGETERTAQLRLSARTRIPALPPASSFVRARRPVFRSPLGSRSRSK